MKRYCFIFLLMGGGIMNRYRVIQIVLLILYIGMLVFFTYECFQTGQKASDQAGNVAQVVASTQEKITGKPVTVDNEYKKTLSKLFGHYGYFCLLGLVSILFYMTLKRFRPYIRFIMHLAVGITFAFLSEFLAEALTEGRNASILDVLIDSLGLVTLSGIFMIIYYIIIYKKNKQTKIEGE